MRRPWKRRTYQHVNIENSLHSIPEAGKKTNFKNHYIAKCKQKIFKTWFFFPLENLNAKANKRQKRKVQLYQVQVYYKMFVAYPTQVDREQPWSYSDLLVISDLKSSGGARGRGRQKGRENKPKQNPGCSLVLDSTARLKIKPASRLLGVHRLLT